VPTSLDTRLHARNVQFGVSETNIQNLLNMTNLAQPIGNLSSPQFGESDLDGGNFWFWTKRQCRGR